ncbi:hypothetical protein [Halarcobacter ebronensis]|uniref:hypothetical protein n=1 Tax=Halarcobacter ebronensis TaxID=1462615 RepID=UPI003C78C446
MTNEELNDFLKVFYRLKESSIVKDYGFDDEWNMFIKKILFLSPKSYGTKIQNRIISKNLLQPVKANEDKGDFKKNNRYFEIKTSLLTITNQNANVTGIRPWQKIEGYYIFIIDARVFESINTYAFRLTKDEMASELEIINNNPVNGTKKANEANQNLPLRFALSLDSEDFTRWTREYLFNNDEIIQKL